ncbi:MAG: DUF1232 domain-containing protein [Anaerolineales bacterium]|nr:DUF1232 domain-containing protein [Anaerolineales bacterium]
MSNPTPTLPAPSRNNVIKQTILRIRLVWRLLWDRRVPLPLKLIPFGGLVYLIVPFDFLSEWMFLVVGAIDDLGVLLGSLWLFVELCPDDVVKEHWENLAGNTVDGSWRKAGEEKGGDAPPKPE